MTEDEYAKKKKQDYFLKVTAQAYNSNIVLKLLQHKVKLSNMEKQVNVDSERRIYKDAVVDKICEFIFVYIPKNFFWELCLEKIFSDMEKYEFSKQPSMNRFQQQNTYLFASDKIEERLNCYEKIDLSRHTLNLIETYFRFFYNSRAFMYLPTINILMSCLLHDFGKSKELAKNDFGSGDIKTLSIIKHEIISGHYILNLISRIRKDYIAFKDKLDDDYETGREQLIAIKDAVVAHHEKDCEEGSLTDALKTIDAQARAIEWTSYQNNLIKKR